MQKGFIMRRCKKYLVFSIQYSVNFICIQFNSRLYQAYLKAYLKDSDKINFDDFRIVGKDASMAEGIGEGERDGDGNEGEKQRSRVLCSVRPFGTICTALNFICHVK